MSRRSRGMPPDHLIRERRRQEAVRGAAQNIVRANERELQKMRWEENANRKLQRNNRHRQQQHAALAGRQDVDQRRARLRALLAQEEASHRAELAAAVETPLERQARLRNRVREVREAREQERLSVVEQRKEQHFLANCTPLRDLRAKQDTKLLAFERAHQLQEKQAMRDHDRYVDEYFQGMLAEDNARAEERERQKASEREQAQRDLYAVLDTQKAALQRVRDQEAALRAKEAELVEEEVALGREAERREQEEARRKAQQARAQMERFSREAIRRKQEEMEAQLALDMKLVRDVMDAGKGEDDTRQKKREEFIREQEMYLGFLREQKAFEKQREEELDTFYLADAEREWSRRAKQWDREKQARELLMHDVVATRQQQVAARRQQVEREQLEAAREHQELVQALKEHAQVEAMQQEQRKRIHDDHLGALTLQIDQQRQARAAAVQADKDSTQRYIDEQRREEEVVQQRLADLRVQGQRTVEAAAANGRFF